MDWGNTPPRGGGAQASAGHGSSSWARGPTKQHGRRDKQPNQLLSVYIFFCTHYIFLALIFRLVY